MSTVNCWDHDAPVCRTIQLHALQCNSDSNHIIVMVYHHHHPPTIVVSETATFLSPIFPCTVVELVGRGLAICRPPCKTACRRGATQLLQYVHRPNSRKYRTGIPSMKLSSTRARCITQLAANIINNLNICIELAADVFVTKKKKRLLSLCPFACACLPFFAHWPACVLVLA